MTQTTCLSIIFLNVIITPGLTDKMAEFWGRVAQEFADNEYVLGYEVINEPWAGQCIILTTVGLSHDCIMIPLQLVT